MSFPNDLWVFLAIHLGVIGLVVYFGLRDETGYNLKEKQLASGRSFLYKRIKRKDSSACRIGVPLQGGFWFTVRRKSWWSRQMQGLGLLGAVPTQHRWLDDKFYCYSDDPQRLQNFLAGGGVINALRGLEGASGFQSLEGRADRLWTHIEGRILTSPSEEDVVPRAAALAELVQKSAADVYTPAAVGALSYRAVATGSAQIGLLFAGVLAFTISALLKGDGEIIDTSAVLWRSAEVTAALAGLWALGLVSTFRPTGRLPALLGSLLLGCIGLYSSVFMAVYGIDIDFDQAPAAIQSLPLLQKTCPLYCNTGGKHARTVTYKLTEQQCRDEEQTIAVYRQQDSRCAHSASVTHHFAFPWPTEEGRRNHEVYWLETRNAALYFSAQVREPFDVPVHPGALGLPWLNPQELKAE